MSSPPVRRGAAAGEARGGTPGRTAGAADEPAGPRLLARLGHPRPLREGPGQLAGVATALAVLAALGAVESETPPSITLGGFLLVVVVLSSWLFSTAAAALIAAAALAVPIVANRVGADDIVATEVEVLAVLVLAAAVQLALRAIEGYEAALASRNEELLAVNAGLERFTADAAHELRAPLALVRTEVETALAMARSPQDYRRHVEAIGAEVERMARSVAGLLTLARADTGVLQGAFADVDLADLLELVAARWRPSAAARDVALHAEVPDTGTIHGDADLLVRLLDNLLDNALRHVDAGGTVALSARRRGPAWVVTVTNTGAPMDEALAHALLDGGTVRRPPGAAGRGDGFGLALCSVIAAVHGGTVRLENRAAGPAFVVEIPDTVTAGPAR